ncbi:MAG TPA: oligopeptide ABC transporter permease OppB, partial [Steroidobacteraceae bacterium]|nr:oligopeptide ABC transporter permease OppB [Steroidobacteraceae bacterium]
MLRYILRRVLESIPTLLLIVTIAFALLHAAPGGPFAADKAMLPEIRHSIEARYHLDEPLWRQYLRYLGDLAHGDLGPSFQYRNTSVNQLIAAGLPVDLTVGLSAIVLALLAGIPIGLNAAWRRHTLWDRLPMGLAVAGISLPVFVVAPLLVLVFAVKLHWLPAGDWVHGSPSHLLLPVAALALPYVAYVARIVRGSALEVLNTSFIRTAHAKGLPAHRILLHHTLRPTLAPVVSFLGPTTAGIVTISIVVETVFGLPGIGRFFVTGALNRDYTLVLGITILYGTLIILFNLLADLCYAWL